MPFNLDRLKRLREIKQLNQKSLAAAAGVTQSQISDCERGIGPGIELLEKLATALDCTTDFLLGRSYDVDDNDQMRDAVSRMAFDVFCRRPGLSSLEMERCRRVLGHSSAPVTAHAWVILSQHIELALGPSPTGTSMRVVSRTS
jgi:transcriptional regulator with XRE-family HTH domain